MSQRFAATALGTFARDLLATAGLPQTVAQIHADTLLEADLLGHDTHGLALLPAHLGEIESGGMRREGEPVIVSDRGACVAWDGLKLSGPWLISRATDLALERAKQFGTCTVVIAHTHHIACLATFLRRATDRGLMMLVMSADPRNANVAPYGGCTGVYSPNPIAAGIPTYDEPILVDVSTSITTNGMTQRLASEDKRFPGQWLVDANGQLSDDPRIMSQQPKGALLPLGGVDVGHKGYALALLVEALTNGLSGQGRSAPGTGWGGTAYIEVLDPDAFGGGAAFLRETTHLAAACRDSTPLDATHPVRLPGEAAAQRKGQQLSDGVRLYPTILPALEPWATKFNLALPQPLP